MLFPFGEYWPFYLGFLLLVFLLLAIDLGVFHRKAHAVSIREAAETFGGHLDIAVPGMLLEVGR